MTWNQIFGVDPPVSGVPYEFERARDEFADRRDAAQGIVDRFATVGEQGSQGNLEGEVGAVFFTVVDEVDTGLADLPRVAREAWEIFDHHVTRLRELRDEADAALGRARTAWNEKNRLEGGRSGQEDTVRSLTAQIRDAAPDADTSDLETQLTTAQGSLGSTDSAIAAQQTILDGIYGDPSSEYAGLRTRERELDDETADALDGIDLGELRDPGWLESFVGAVGDIVGGVLESVVNLLEAFVTGDWATFFWELKQLLDVALLVLGTIALFTGVGAPLFALAVANFVITAGLWMSQTPNPQTGETMGLSAVAWSAAGVVMSSAGFLRNIKGIQGWRLFTREAARTPGVFGWTATGSLKPGAIQTLWQNLGRLNTIRTAPISAHGSWQGLATFTKGVPYYGSSSLANAALRADAVVSSVWQARGVFSGVSAFNPVDLGPVNTVTGAGNWSSTIDKLATGGGSGFTTHSGWGNVFQQGTPVYGSTPPPTPEQVREISGQMAGSPDVVVVAP